MRNICLIPSCGGTVIIGDGGVIQCSICKTPVPKIQRKEETKKEKEKEAKKES